MRNALVISNNCQKTGRLARNYFLLNSELGHFEKDCKLSKNLVSKRCGDKSHTSKNCTASVEQMNEWRKEFFLDKSVHGVNSCLASMLGSIVCSVCDTPS